MMHTVIAAFDPISQSELVYLKQYRQNHQLRDLYVGIKKEGILPYEVRKELVRTVLLPYRHLHVSEETEGEEIPETDEESIRSGLFYLAARGIKKYLLENGLYFEEIVRHRCKERRAQHSLSVAATAVKLARMHGCDERRAWQAGMLHDVTKAWSEEEHEKLLKIYDPGKLTYESPVWHSFTAVYWLRENTGIHDQKILNAIFCHTLGNGKSDLDHILYIADKIEPNRKYDTSVYWQIAGRSLREAADKVHYDAKQYILKTEGRHV